MIIGPAISPILSPGEGTPLSAAWLAQRMIARYGAGLSSLLICDDVVPSGLIPSIPLRFPLLGTALPAGLGKATALTILGRRSAVFSANAQAQGYSLLSNQLTQIAIARWDSTLPFGGFVGMLGGQGAPRLIGETAQSRILASGTIYRDGVATQVIDLNPHLWEASFNSGTANTRQIGGSDATGVNNWIGPIWFGMQLSVQQTAQQRADSLADLKKFYPFLP